MHSVVENSVNEYAARIAGIHAQLGIAGDYAALRQLSLCEETTDLVDIGLDINQRMRQLTPAAAAAWRTLQQHATQAGVELLVVSAFRSVNYQRDLIARKLAKGENIDTILQVLAAPGYSEHHTGRALDLTVPGLQPLQESFEATPAFPWLGQHAGRYGFRLSYPRDNPHGFIYEPWHWAFHES